METMSTEPIFPSCEQNVFNYLFLWHLLVSICQEKILMIREACQLNLHNLSTYRSSFYLRTSTLMPQVNVKNHNYLNKKVGT